MTDNRNNIDRLFATARTEPPVVTFDETRAAVEERQRSGSQRTHTSRTTTSTIMITSGLTILAAAAIGFLTWNPGGVDGKIEQSRPNANGEELVRRTDAMNERSDGRSAPAAEGVERSRLIRDAGPSTDLGGEERKRPNDNGTDEEKDSSGLFVEPAPFITGLRMIELSREELGRLGLQPDTAGVWYFWRQGSGASGMEITTTGIMLPPPDKDWRNEGTEAPSFQPVFVTDDFGNRRMESFKDDDYEVRQEEVELQVQEIERQRGEKLEAEERFMLAMKLQSQQSEQRLATGNFIPVIVRTGRSYIGRGWRPDCIFWYEPSPEFLAALPERVRLALERELLLASVLRGKPEHESIDAFMDRQPLEVRQAFDSLRGTEERSSTAAIAGETYIGSLSAVSGAITFSSVSPNPATDRILIQYRLAEPRNASVELYNVNGGHVRTLVRNSLSNSGENLRGAFVDDVPPGIYLLVISTEKERAIQRVIVE